MSITDLTRGRPAEGVRSSVEVQVKGMWRPVARTVSDASGVILIDGPVVAGIYRVELDVEPYFASIGVLPVMPRVTIAFRLSGAYEHSLLRTYIAASSHFSVLVTSEYPIILVENRAAEL